MSTWEIDYRRSSDCPDGSWGPARRRRSPVGAAASPLITTLKSDDGSGYIAWPNAGPGAGFDNPTVHMCLVLDSLLLISLLIITGLIYHWSRPHTNSLESLHGAKDAKFQVRQNIAAMEETEEGCKSWGDHASQPDKKAEVHAAAITIPPAKAHTPPAQSIAELQRELKRLQKKEEKSPSATRRNRITKTQERLTGLARSQGWLTAKEEDISAATLCIKWDCCDDDIDVDEESPAVHKPPSIKTCCMTSCGCCPCELCQDNEDLTEARDELASLESDMADPEIHEQLIQMYMSKGKTKEQAEASIEQKVAEARERAAYEQEVLGEKQQTKVGGTFSIIQTAVTMPCMVGMWSWPALVGIGSAGAAAGGGSTLSGDISLIITILTFPLTIFSLYYKAKDRRGLRPLLFYIPGGLMMCQYVVLTSISEHEPSQMAIYDSKRLKRFTFDLQILGIIVTIVANLWNASADVTIANWLKKKDLACWEEEWFSEHCGCGASNDEGDGMEMNRTASDVATPPIASGESQNEAPWKGTGTSE